MDWKTLLSDIAKAGYSQSEIADELGIRQPSVSDIANGKTKSPSWVVGDRIIKLHRKAEQRKRRAQAAA